MNELVLSQDFGSTQIDMISVPFPTSPRSLKSEFKEKSYAQNTTLCWAENRVADFSITIVHKLR
jgi:hypothetical protein